MRSDVVPAIAPTTPPTTPPVTQPAGSIDPLLWGPPVAAVGDTTAAGVGVHDHVTVGAPTEPVRDQTPRGRGRARFATGLIAGVALTGAAVGGYALGTSDDGPGAGATSAPSAAEEVTAKPVSVDLGSGATIAELVAAVRPSIVSVHQEVTQTGPFGGVSGTAAGTGWVLSADGYIVTNAHVVAEGDTPVVTFADGTSEPATIVAADETRDLAVLEVDRDDLAPLAVGDSDELELGDPLIAIGYALDLNGEPSVTSGILSAKERSIATDSSTQLIDLLQTDAAINPGNSGGPLLNSEGEVVGINTAIAGEAQNIGFAIAITPAMTVIESLQGGTVPERALMGVSTTVRSDGGQGAEVVEINPGTGAAASDLRIGDVIVAVDGEDVDDPTDLGTAIARRQPGDEVVVTVDRNGSTDDLTIILGARDD